MLKSNKLGFATSTGTETMLAVGVNAVLVHMLHDIAMMCSSILQQRQVKEKR